MPHRFLLLSASLLVLPLAGRAQTAVPTPLATLPAPPASQLDRIEGKLDEVLRRLDRLEQVSPRPAANPQPTSAPASEGYRPGALAVARAAPHDPSNFVSVPTDAVGGFVYTGGAISLNDIATRGVRYTGPVGIELQGWLRAQEAGRYQISADINIRFTVFASYGITCFYQAWIEDRSLGQRTTPLLGRAANSGSNEVQASLVLGAELQPGLYRLRTWTVCNPPPGLTLSVDTLLKAPSELNLRPLTAVDVVHKEGR